MYYGHGIPNFITRTLLGRHHKEKRETIMVLTRTSVFVR